MSLPEFEAIMKALNDIYDKHTRQEGSPVSEQTKPTAEEVAKDYSFEQFVADIAGTTVEEVRRDYMRACELIGEGRTSQAAVEQILLEALADEGTGEEVKP